MAGGGRNKALSLDRVRCEVPLQPRGAVKGSTESKNPPLGERPGGVEGNRSEMGDLEWSFCWEVAGEGCDL